MTKLLKEQEISDLAIRKVELQIQYAKKYSQNSKKSLSMRWWKK